MNIVFAEFDERYRITILKVIVRAEAASATGVSMKAVHRHARRGILGWSDVNSIDHIESFKTPGFLLEQGYIEVAKVENE